MNYKFIKPRRGEISFNFGKYTINSDMTQARALILKNELEELVELGVSLGYELSYHYDYYKEKYAHRNIKLVLGKDKDENGWFNNKFELIVDVDRYNRWGSYWGRHNNNKYFAPPNYGQVGNWVVDIAFYHDSTEYLDRLLLQIDEMKESLKREA